jgi:pteridine reductase
LWEATPLATLSAEEVDRALAINLRSPFLLAVRLGRAMKEAGEGVIINVLDWSVDRPYADYLPYGIAKAGLAAATRGLARGLAPEVRVNGVAPGAVLLPEGIDHKEADTIRRAIPLQRIGQPSDVAEAVVYLALAEYVSGTILTIDGGRSVR